LSTKHRAAKQVWKVWAIGQRACFRELPEPRVVGNRTPSASVLICTRLALTSGSPQHRERQPDR
jgi:hypothetical protein